MKLSGDQYERLHMVLRDRFADYAALAFFLRTQLDVSLEEISGDQGLFTVAIAVIGEAEAKRWVDALLERLHQQFPGDPTVAALCAELKAATGGAGSAQHSSARKPTRASSPWPCSAPPMAVTTSRPRRLWPSACFPAPAGWPAG